MTLSTLLNDEFSALEFALVPTVGANPNTLGQISTLKNRIMTEHIRL